MRRLRRPVAPAILVENEGRWTAAYLAKRADNPRAKPDSRHYRHREIVDALASMSFHKCFYCEQALGERSEVDHYVEVSEAPERAFAWPNLYLACFECNRRKAPNSQRSAAECLDPCEPTQDPAEHLTFEDEIIRARSASERGLATIQKYLLDREDLNYKRLVQLKHFLHALDRIRQIHERESRRGMSAPEAELLAAFAAPDHPFSLMFRVLLERSGFEDSRGLD